MQLGWPSLRPPCRFDGCVGSHRCAVPVSVKNRVHTHLTCLGFEAPRSRTAPDSRQKRLACGSSPLHRHLRHRPLPPALARWLRRSPARRPLVPPSWFCTTSTACSGDGPRVCCTPVPVVGFVALASTAARAVVAFPRRPALRRFAPRRQPCRLTTACCPPDALRRPPSLAIERGTDGVRSRRACTRTGSTAAPGPPRRPSVAFPPWMHLEATGCSSPRLSPDEGPDHGRGRAPVVGTMTSRSTGCPAASTHGAR
jgi:hypothetical protein